MKTSYNPRLIMRNERLPPNYHSSDWYKELRTAYEPFVSASDYSMIKNCFGELFSLFPFIRKMKRSVMEGQTGDVNYLLLFAAVITDQGLLAEQTRDGGDTAEGYLSRICTIMSTLPQLGNSHECSKMYTLRYLESIMKPCQKNRRICDSFIKLLDLFRLECAAKRKSVQAVFQASQCQKPDSELQSGDTEDAYPNEAQIEFAKNSKIVFSKKNV